MRQHARAIAIDETGRRVALVRALGGLVAALLLLVVILDGLVR